MKHKNFLTLDFLILQVFLLEIKEIAFGTLNVEKGVTGTVNAVLSENASFFIKKSKSGNVTQNITFRKNLEAPIEKGETIGTVAYTLDGEVIKSINIIAENDVKRLNLFNMTMSIYRKLV